MPITYTPLTDQLDATLDHTLRLSVDGHYISPDAGGVAALRLRLAAEITATNEGEVVAPSIPAHASLVLSVVADAEASGGADAYADASLRLVLFSSPGAAMDAALRLSLQSAPTSDVSFFLQEPEPVTAITVGIDVASVQERVLLAGDTTRLYMAMAREWVALREGHTPTYSGTVSAADTLGFRDTMDWVLWVMATSGLALGDIADPQYSLMASAVSRMILSGSATNVAEAIAQLTEALGFAAAMEALQLAEAADAVVFNALLESAFRLVAEVIDRVLFAATPLTDYLLTVAIDERFFVNTAATHQLDMATAIREGLAFTLFMPYDNGASVAWTMDLASKAQTTYTNFNFNSFATIGSKVFAAHAGGIHVLGGPDDAGEPIRARLRTGIHDFGTRDTKSFSDVFVALTTDGTMLLKTITIEKTGRRVMAIYKMKQRAATEGIRETRFEIGRGIVAVDWDIELENVDGADFDIRNLNFVPTNLSRRTRG